MRVSAEAEERLVDRYARTSRSEHRRKYVLRGSDGDYTRRSRFRPADHWISRVLRCDETSEDLSHLRKCVTRSSSVLRASLV